MRQTSNGLTCLSLSGSASDDPAMELRVPDLPRALLLVASGSGRQGAASSHRFVADVLFSVGVATLTFPLRPGLDGSAPVDLGAATRRIEQMLALAAHDPCLAALPTGLMGAGDAAAATLLVAALHTPQIFGVTVHSGDLGPAAAALVHLGTKAMLLVGADDRAASGRYRAAVARASHGPALVEVPRVHDLCAGGGGLQAVAVHVARWCLRRASAASSPGVPLSVPSHRPAKRGESALC